jgi:diadenosine tetraphosphate (Ap4A) HIT family hydrolase
MTCPFCTIDQEKNRIIKEKTHVLAILSNPRLMPGHILVIPKRHIEKLSELGEEEQKELFDTAIEFQEKILNKIAKGCDIAQHYRPFIRDNKFKVSHLHIHLQPRELKDKLYQKVQIHNAKVFKDLTDKEAKEIIEILKP